MLKTFKRVYCLSTARVHSLRFYSLKKFALARKLVNDMKVSTRVLKWRIAKYIISLKRFVMVVTLNQNHDNELCPVCPWSTLQALVFVWCFFFFTWSWTTTNPPWDKIISKYLGAIVRKRWINNIIIRVPREGKGRGCYSPCRNFYQ